MRIARFTIPAEEAAHIDYPDSTTELVDDWEAFAVNVEDDGSLTIWAQKRPGDE